jgi:hypothetical protein
MKWESVEFGEYLDKTFGHGWQYQPKKNIWVRNDQQAVAKMPDSTGRIVIYNPGQMGHIIDESRVVIDET